MMENEGKFCRIRSKLCVCHAAALRQQAATKENGEGIMNIGYLESIFIAKINRYNLWIPVASALLIWLLGFSPIWIIIAAGVGGFLWGKLRKVKS